MLLSYATHIVAILALTTCLAPLQSTARSNVAHKGGYCVPRRNITSTTSIYPSPTRAFDHTVTTITTTLVTITTTRRIAKYIRNPAVPEYKILKPWNSNQDYEKHATERTTRHTAAAAIIPIAASSSESLIDTGHVVPVEATTTLELPKDNDSQKSSSSTSTNFSTFSIASAPVDPLASATSSTSSILPLPSTSTDSMTPTTTLAAPAVSEAPAIPKVTAAPTNSTASLESKAEVGGLKPCEISVYSYDPPEVCSNTYNTGGACGLSTYFPDTLGDQLPRLAVPNAIFDGFGQSQHNTLCGKTVTIKAANGKIGKAIIADRNQGTSFDLCMDLWVEFGYGSGGGRFQAEYTFD